MRIFRTRVFARFARAEAIDDTVLAQAVRRMTRLGPDADLGGGVVKLRLARRGEGLSGGYRSIVVVRRDDMAIFVYGYAKSDKASLTARETQAFKALGREFLSYDAAVLDRLVAAHELFEVRDAEEDL